MPKPQLLSVEESAALGAKLSQVDVVANHPMPFSAGIADELRKMHPSCHFIDCSTLSSSINAAMGASLGKRTFVPVSIPKSVEDIFTLSYMRLPVVFTNVSRPLGTFSIRHDHSDVAALLDSGCLVFMPESNQELIETIIQAYKVSEQVLLPSIVNIDIAHYREHVNPVLDIFVRRFLGRYKPPYSLDKKPRYVAVPDDNYADLKKQQHKAVKDSAEIIDKTSGMWFKKFRRSLPLVETYKTDDADFVLVMSGFHSTTAKAAVDKLRGAGKKVGLLRLRVLRPWPSALIESALKNAKRTAVFDQAASLGRFGMLYRELNDKGRCTNIISLGRYLSEGDFVAIFERLGKGRDEIVWA